MDVESDSMMGLWLSSVLFQAETHHCLVLPFSEYGEEKEVQGQEGVFCK